MGQYWVGSSLAIILMVTVKTLKYWHTVMKTNNSNVSDVILHPKTDLLIIPELQVVLVYTKQAQWNDQSAHLKQFDHMP